jgi:transposase
MQVMYECCCGIDVHKKMVVACMNKGGKQELRQFDTMTDSLRMLCTWLQENNCQMVAMESTASYWKPLYNLFEASAIEAMVVNAAHMKALPGRKTDMKDAAWISDLLRHGLLQASYIPDREQRELREAARYRKSLVEERARELNRLQKMLEGANIKLKSTLSNINGKSARGLIEQLIAGKTLSAEETAQFLQGSARKKLDEVMRAMDGVATRMQRSLLGQVVDHIDDMTRRIKDMDELIHEQMEQYEQAIRAIDEIPGIGRRSAETILSEIGLDMGRFPSAAHLCSWAGICPGNHESAGKRYSGRIRPGNQALKTILVECAKSASKMSRSFFSAQFRRIAARRGNNRATVAVAHSILIAIYHILKDGAAFKDLGSEYYTRFNRERKIAGYLRKLKELGWSAPAIAPA